MEIILTKDVEKLGKSGDVVKVKDGFARNFLIPKGLAVFSTAANIKRLESEKQKKTQQLENARSAAEALKSKLANLSLTIAVLAQDDEKLYGSIAAAEISQALKDEGLDVAKDCIALDEPIKALGIFEVPVNLLPGVSAKIKVWVVKK